MTALDPLRHPAKAVYWVGGEGGRRARQSSKLHPSFLLSQCQAPQHAKRLLAIFYPDIRYQPELYSFSQLYRIDGAVPQHAKDTREDGALAT